MSRMNKDAAIQSFFSSFSLTAYPATSVPTNGPERPEFPYLTYILPTDSDIGRIFGTASLWYRSESWTEVNSKVREISQAIGAGVTIECDEGAMIVRKGSPFAQPMGDDSDNMIKRKILNFEVLFVTTY